RLEGKDTQGALEINKLILRFVGDRNLQSWQEVLLGNYIASRGLGNPALRNEILSQVVSQVWKNPDTEQSKQGYALMAALLSAFTPLPALEKPLLKFVSDHGLEGYNAVCQHKILTAMQQTDMDPEVSRAHPPTLLEWTANQRRGKMVLDVFTYNEETFSAEVESWTTGEQYAGWILSEVWQDLPGCDFVLDLIGEMEEAGHPSLSSADYPITPEWEGSPSRSASLDIDGKPLCMSLSSVHIGSANGSRSAWGAAWDRKRFPTWESLTVMVALVASFHLGYPGMMQVPAYQPIPMMGGMMPAPMPMMPAPMPGNKMQKWPTPAPPSPPPAPKQKVQEKKAKKEPCPVVAADLAPKREPSREIRNIIKMYQSRPAPEPQPIVPIRPSKSFLKKSDPKNEALAKLGMASLQPPKSVSTSPASPEPANILGAPPPPPAKKGQTATSIREKQQPLMNLFGQQPTSPVASLIPPPPPCLPPPLPPADQATQQSEPKEDASIKTQLYKLTASVSFSYTSTPWKIFLRKEVFYPKETFSHPYCLNLLCEQIMQDTYSESCVRVSKEERRKMKDLLGNRWLEFQVGTDATSILEDGIKKRIVVAARDNWANYFSRLFPVKGERGSDIQLLGVSHRGIRLLKMAKAAMLVAGSCSALFSFADMLSVELKGSSSLEFSLKNEQLILHSAKAQQVKAMVELFLRELKQDSNYVIALRSYVTDDKSLLSFKKGDLIQLLPMQGLEPGWQFGSIGGRSGLFPSSMVQLAAAPDYFSTHMNRQERLQKSLKRDHLETSVSREVRPPVGWGRHGWALKNHTPGLHQPHLPPIQSQSNAGSCIAALMRFMGDQPTLKNQAEIDYIYEILQVRGPPDGNVLGESCIHGWRLLSLLTGFFLPSNILMPYATKFLQQASADPASTQDLARTCYGNLRKMIMYGGRRHLPFRVEMEALLVAAEVVQEICEQMGINEQEEIQEFALFVRKLVRPVRQYEYIHDYLLEDSSVILDLRRLSWKTPLHFENEIYISVHYSQVTSGVSTICTSSLRPTSHRAESRGTVHSAKGLLQRANHMLRTPLGQQEAKIQFVGEATVDRGPWERKGKSPYTVSLPAEHVIQLPLFGYNTYPVERCSEPRIPLPCVLGVNRDQIVIVASRSQELCCRIPLKEVQRMRTLRPLDDTGEAGLEVNYGSVDNPQTMWFELHQVKRALSTACYWPCNECSYWDDI
uniref:Myosin XVB n=1 Tax=Chelonoidis abingdonii TaxID=106734 RepID=A0A8C0GW81_CHEAB